MATSPSDRDILMSSKGVPRSPFEIQVTKDALQKRIDKGDISQDDINILKKAYQWMTISTVVGSTLGVPAFIALRRRRPPMSLGLTFVASSALGLAGTFLGFAMGGAAAALEVNNNMPDAGRKIKVFQQIVIDSKRAIEESRATGVPPTLPTSSPSGSTSRDDAGFSSDASSSGSNTSDPDAAAGSSAGREGRVGGVAGEINQATQGTWDRIRSASVGESKGAQTGAGGAGAVSAGIGGREGGEDERSREQREFDELLERERRGVNEKEDVWR